MVGEEFLSLDCHSSVHFSLRVSLTITPWSETCHTLCYDDIVTIVFRSSDDASSVVTFNSMSTIADSTQCHFLPAKINTARSAPRKTTTMAVS